jgi:hypothetical protein
MLKETSIVRRCGSPVVHVHRRGEDVALLPWLVISSLVAALLAVMNVYQHFRLQDCRAKSQQTEMAYEALACSLGGCK